MCYYFFFYNKLLLSLLSLLLIIITITIIIVIIISSIVITYIYILWVKIKTETDRCWQSMENSLTNDEVWSCFFVMYPVSFISWRFSWLKRYQDGSRYIISYPTLTDLYNSFWTPVFTPFLLPFPWCIFQPSNGIVWGNTADAADAAQRHGFGTSLGGFQLSDELVAVPVDEPGSPFLATAKGQNYRGYHLVI